MARPRSPFPTKTYNIILSEELYDWVQKTARTEGKSGAAYIRELLSKEKRIADRLDGLIEALDQIASDLDAVAPATVPALGDGS